jgi:two-component system, NarL family, nitrate/nitrite response regulator NarL
MLVDDHTLFRQSLARLLNSQPDIELKMHFGSAGEALLAVATGLADLVLLDVDLGSERGIDFLAQARTNGFRGPVLLLTAGVSNNEKEILERHGIAGIVRKDVSVDELATAIRNAMGAPSPPGGTGGSHIPAETRPFSPRETWVLRLVVEGCANKEIAAELDLTEASVKAVMQQLFRKTGTHTRSQLVRMALEQLREYL